MRTVTQQEILDIIRFEIFGTPMPEDFCVSDEDSLLKLARKHDLSHLVFDALVKNGIQCSSESAMKQYYASIWRVEQMTHELQSLTDLFEAEGIDFIPLKGAVMRPMYPEPWMRTSSDLDILLRDKDYDRACDLMIGKLEYAKGHADAVHVMSLHAAENGVNVEAHRALFAEYHTDRSNTDLLPLIWEHALPCAGHEHLMQMSDPCFYFYHIAHMAKHLKVYGGCPIRSLIDLRILDELPERNDGQRSELLQSAGLLTFARMMSNTAKAWFGGGEVPSEELEQFILTGHMYGDLKDQVLMSVDSDGLAKYLLKRMFLPYDVMADTYPVLRKHKWLTPFFHIIRWTNLFRKKRRDKLRYRAKTLIHASQEEANHINHIKEILGINNTEES